MTVQDLIEQLQAIEDKNTAVRVWIDGNRFSIDNVDDIGDVVDITIGGW